MGLGILIGKVGKGIVDIPIDPPVYVRDRREPFGVPVKKPIVEAYVRFVNRYSATLEM